MEDKFSIVECVCVCVCGFLMIREHDIYCALSFFYYYSSSTSDHQALDPRFNPFTFKVIIDNYYPVAICFIVLGSSLYTLFLCFLSTEDPLAFVGELLWWC